MSSFGLLPPTVTHSKQLKYRVRQNSILFVDIFGSIAWRSCTDSGEIINICPDVVEGPSQQTNKKMFLKGSTCFATVTIVFSYQ